MFTNNPWAWTSWSGLTRRYKSNEQNIIRLENFYVYLYIQQIISCYIELVFVISVVLSSFIDESGVDSNPCLLKIT
jgi:hypothetical protein